MALMDQQMDIHSAIISEPNVPTTENIPTIDLAICYVDLIRNSHWSEVDDLVSDHIASHILIRNSFVPARQASTRRADRVKHSKTLQTLTPDISSNPDIDTHHDNILEAVQLAADHSVLKHTENKYNRRTNCLPPEGNIYT